ncbi:MAG TPA: flagellar hook-basal body complex protein, partial [Lacipirellulaceae bacterium]|nr:flagellar hook-basal body complex protein [Lacipirellulaceae bacterium]
TRNGQFKTNSLNELVTSTGHRVMGYGIDDNFVVQTDQVVPLTIPFGGSAVAQETNNVQLLGNLLPNQTGASVPGIIESVILSDSTLEFPTTAPTTQQISPPAAGTAAAQGPGTGAIGPGTYSYRVAWVDPSAPAGNDEGAASVAFGGITIPAAGTDSIFLNNLPTVPPDPAYTQKRIYRIDSAAATPTYELVETLGAAVASHIDTDAAGTTPLNPDNVGLGGNYSYFVTYYDSINDVESRPTPQSSSVAISGSDRRIRLDGLPTPTDPNFNTIRIYRNTVASPNSYFLVDTLPSGTTTYIDNSEDADLGATLNQNGPPVNTGTLLDDLTTFDGTNYVDLFEPNTVLRFTGAKGTGDGLELAEQELPITATTTVLDLLNFMQSSLGIETTSGDPLNPLSGSPGGSVTSTGQLRFESNAGAHNAVHVPDNAFVMEFPDGTLQEVPLTFPTDAQDSFGHGTTTQMVVFDSLGIPVTVRLSTVLESTTGGVTTYRWFATSADNQTPGVDTTVGTGLMSFDNTGQFVDATNSTISINRTDVAANTPVSFDLDFSQVTALSNLSGSPGNLQMSSQDGFPAGSLSSFSITESGRLKGVYTNGVSRDLGQIVMARFINNNGLQQIGDSLWAEAVNSGEPLLDTPGESGI